VEAHVRERARRRDHRRDEVLRLRPGGVDDDVGGPELVEDGEGRVAVLVVEPAAVAELDERPVAAELLTAQRR
jgi:hypothetical protein